MMASPPPPRHVPAQLNASYTSLGGDGRTHAPWHDAWMMLGTYFGFGTSVVCSGARGRYILHCTPLTTVNYKGGVVSGPITSSHRSSGLESAYPCHAFLPPCVPLFAGDVAYQAPSRTSGEYRLRSEDRAQQRVAEGRCTIDAHGDGAQPQDCNGLRGVLWRMVCVLGPRCAFFLGQTRRFIKFKRVERGKVAPRLWP